MVVWMAIPAFAHKVPQARVCKVWNLKNIRAGSTLRSGVWGSLCTHMMWQSWLARRLSLTNAYSANAKNI